MGTKRIIMKAKIKNKKNIEQLKVGLKGGDIVEVKEIEFDEVFNEKMYRIIGNTLRLPESDLELINE